MDDSLTTWDCSLTLSSAIPYAGYVTGIAVVIIQIILLKKLKETSNVVIQFTQA